MPRPALDPEHVVHPTAALRELRRTLQEALEGLQEPRKGFGGTCDPRRDIAALSGLLERVEQTRLVVMAGAWCADGPGRLTLAVMADQNPTITEEQRGRLDQALTVVLTEGVPIQEVTAAQLTSRLDGGARKTVVLAYLREMKAKAPDTEDAIPAPPEDLATASVQALVRAVWEAAYTAARAEVAETVAEAVSARQAAEDAAAQAQDELDTAREEFQRESSQLEARLNKAKEQVTRDAGAARDAATAATEARAREGEVRAQLAREQERTAALEARMDALIAKLTEPVQETPEPKEAPTRSRRTGAKKTPASPTEPTKS